MKLPANWKTTFSGIGAAIFATLTVIAGLPYDLGSVATVIPPEWKAKVVIYGLFATLGLKVWNSIVQKSKEVTGGSVQQTLDGSKAPTGSQTLVDLTKEATPKT